MRRYASVMTRLKFGIGHSRRSGARTTGAVQRPSGATIATGSADGRRRATAANIAVSLTLGRPAKDSPCLGMRLREGRGAVCDAHHPRREERLEVEGHAEALEPDRERSVDAEDGRRGSRIGTGLGSGAPLVLGRLEVASGDATPGSSRPVVARERPVGRRWRGTLRRFGVHPGISRGSRHTKAAPGQWRCSPGWRGSIPSLRDGVGEDRVEMPDLEERRDLVDQRVESIRPRRRLWSATRSIARAGWPGA